MLPEQYETYTQLLVDLAQADTRILSLIVLGSTAATHHQPDQWSDHDFWLVVADGTQAQFHDDLTWLPQHHRMVLAFRETQHGWKVIFENGHVLEYAIFSREELNVARFHHYKILIDKADVTKQLEALKTTFVVDTANPNKIAQHILSLIVIGMGRYHRGEQLSGMLFIKHHVVEQLTALIQATVPPQQPRLVDDLSPGRRIEFTHPQYTEHLHRLITLPVPEAAQTIVDIVVSLKDEIPDFPSSAIKMVQTVIHQ